MKQQQHLYATNSKLGNSMAQGQQTTRIVYDQISVGSATTHAEAFTNFTGKTNVQTNLKEGKLPSGESMIVKEIDFVSEAAVTGEITVDLYIGTLKVVKDLPVHFAAYAGTDWQPLNRGTTTRFSVRLVTNVTIPAQVEFKVVLKSAAATFTDATVLNVALKGFGVLFNSQTSL